MSAKESYCDWLKKDLGSLIDTLDLNELQKKFLRSRWLDQVLWMEGKADKDQKHYYALRLISIIGGVITPSLVSLNLSGENIAIALRLITFFLSLIVAISIAIEEFFHYGDRWRHYRHTVERLKVEGWQFFQLCGPYKEFTNHADAYKTFSARVEEVQQHETEIFISEVVKEKNKDPGNG